MHKGIGASSGFAIGKAFVMPAWEWELPETMDDVTDLAYEFERLYQGIRTSKVELESIKDEIAEILGSEESNIFDAHLAILEDPVFMNEVQAIMQRQFKAAEVAVKEAVDKFVNMFDLLDDEYMKERALDIKDVGNRLLKHLVGAYEQQMMPPREHPYILVTKELTPSQMAHLDTTQLLGIVTMLGGKTSHVAIMARALGIPYILGFEENLEKMIQTGDCLILDGESGLMYVNPEPERINEYAQKKQKWAAFREKLQEIVEFPSVTPDGEELHLLANISTLKELEIALKYGAAGVGLFRTEFLYMDRSNLPKEDEQFEVYRKAAEALKGKPLVIRTLDIGGDKQLDYFPLPPEENPALGFRAIRISLDRRDLFKTQLKAILRAGVYGNVKIMYPMISSLDEIRRANEVLELAKQELQAANQPYASQIDVGIMIEVPGAVAIADLLAREVQFFSIGTNDLVQYVLAVDRMNEQISHLYEPYHPAVLRLLKQTVDAARQSGISVSVCGELAGDIRAMPIWLGLGVRDLSVSVQSLLPVKKRVLSCRADESRLKVSQLFQCHTTEQIKGMLPLSEGAE